MINDLIHRSPFTRFKKGKFDSKINSWKKPFDEDVYTKILSKVRPDLIIELGSFLGYSAISMMTLCKKMNLNSKIICVDTWLGGSDHYIHKHGGTDNLFFEFFKIENGISGNFDQFCINVVNSDLENDIIPFANTTDNAFVYFKHLNIKADLIFIDASHTELHVYNDIKNYYKLLTDRGVMFGHDSNWAEIKNAVNKFCKENSLEYSELYNKYWIIN